MSDDERKNQLRLMAHLMRRAGFTATRKELEDYNTQGYNQTVEKLLHPQGASHLPDDIIRRYHVGQYELRQLDEAAAYWMYRMITTENPLEEKMALFWHGLFATGYSKLNQARVLLNQVDMFRKYGLGSFKDLLIELSKDPAMIIWLDNNENHNGAINENYGRELLELFSMGIGNYSEQDIKECARAFTGWTVKMPITWLCEPARIQSGRTDESHGTTNIELTITTQEVRNFWIKRGPSMVKK